MANMADARSQSSTHRIQEALAKLLRTTALARISVSDLAREAHVSRSTFYAHYDNVGDVYEELVEQVMADVRTFGEQFPCDSAPCKDREKPLYCERVRSEGRFSGVVKEARFFPAMMELAWGDPDIGTDAATRGVPQATMRALRLFQMSGCHAVATSAFANREDWEDIRDAMDAFIEGGMRAVQEMHRTRR